MGLIDLKFSKAQTEPILNQSIFQSHKRSEMKRVPFVILAFTMAVLFAPVVFAGEIGQRVDMPEYLLPGKAFIVAKSTANCRDVNHVHNLFIYKSDQIKNPAFAYTTNGGSLEMIPETYKNHKGAAVLTDRTVFSRWQSADTTVFAGKIDKYNKSLDPTEDPASIKLDSNGTANHKEAATLTDRTTFYAWQSANNKLGKTYLKNIENAAMAGRIV